jgi:hypothetical protein
MIDFDKLNPAARYHHGCRGRRREQVGKGIELEGDLLYTSCKPDAYIN